MGRYMNNWSKIALIFMLTISVMVSHAVTAEHSIAGVSAQKWEYKVIFRYRDANYMGAETYRAADWTYIEDGTKELGTIDIIIKTKELGEAGWELAEISARSGNPNFPGFTTEETWIFKRPK